MSATKGAFVRPLLLAWLFIGNASAAELRLEGTRIFVSGLLEASDVKDIERRMEHSSVTELVFENSLGGTVAAAKKYVELIKQKGLRTSVEGKCFSACAIAFIAGKERRFGSSLRTHMVMLHVARRKGNEAMESPHNDELLAYIDALAENKLTDTVKALIRKSWTAASGVLFFAKPGLFGVTRGVMYCDGTQGTDANKCKVLNGEKVEQLGISVN